MMWYTLTDNKDVVPCDFSDLIWDARFRRVAISRFKVWEKRKPRKCGYKTPPKKIRVWVSTVFLPIDHGYTDEDRPPVVFESMAFREPSYRDLICNRCCTWKEAVEMHKETCKQLSKEYRKT